MNDFKLGLLSAAIAGGLASQPAVASDSVAEAITSGKVSFDFNVRYEDVETDVSDSDRMTLRSRMGYKTGDYKGFSAFAEFEDVSDLFGVDDENGLIPDPEVTELDQAYIQYKNDLVTAKLGRQVITLDGHRYVGHVGWRQDRQTFDAARVQLTPVEGLNVDLMHITKRNRIFAETADANSADNLLNVSYMTPVGKLVGYAYLLDDKTLDRESDTYGVSLTGNKAMDSVTFLYALEAATQESTQSGIDYDTEYLLAELGFKVSGVTTKVGYELLGSDDGAASFSTPLATLHKFNGWADVFLGGTFTPTAMPNGLEDVYLSVGSKVGPVALKAAYHDYSSDEGSTDYGSEIDAVASMAFAKNYKVGIKYSAYSDDGFNAAGDVDKLWLWVGAKF